MPISSVVTLPMPPSVTFPLIWSVIGASPPVKIRGAVVGDVDRPGTGSG